MEISRTYFDLDIGGSSTGFRLETQWLHNVGNLTQDVVFCEVTDIISVVVNFVVNILLLSFVKNDVMNSEMCFKSGFKDLQR